MPGGALQLPLVRALRHPKREATAFFEGVVRCLYEYPWPSGKEEAQKNLLLHVDDGILEVGSDLLLARRDEFWFDSEDETEEDDDNEEAEAVNASTAEPLTYWEAISSNEADKWNEAMNEEFMWHIGNQTWSLVELSEGEHTIGSK